MDENRCFQVQGLILPFLAFLVLLGLVLPLRGQAEDVYRFQRMWPTLPQPWYFSSESVAVDKQGNVYVVDGSKYRVQKFTSDGEFLTKWGSNGDGDGQFECP